MFLETITWNMKPETIPKLREKNTGENLENTYIYIDLNLHIKKRITQYANL